MANSILRNTRLLRTRSHPELVTRLGLSAATKYDRAIRLYTAGGAGALLCSAVFMIATSAGLHPIATAALAFAFTVLIPCMLVAALLTFSVTKEVSSRWDISPRSKPPLTTKALKSAAHFDQWLAAHHKQPPARPPFGSPVG